MIFGLGVDIVETKRFAKYAQKQNFSFIEKVFPPQERLFLDTPDAQKQKIFCLHYACRFAAKEAFAKALGTGLVFDTKDVFITKKENGAPQLNIKGKALELCQKLCGKAYKLFVSLSHEKDYAIATVIIEV